MAIVLPSCTLTFFIYAFCYIFGGMEGVREVLNNRPFAVLFGDNMLPLQVFAIAVIAPIQEELFYRGFVVRALQQSTADYHLVLFAQALLFGLMHYFVGGWLHVLTTFVLGTMIGRVYIKRRSLTLAMMIHMINNALVLSIPLLYQRFA